MFSRSGWSVVRNASLAKGGTSKKGPLSHLYKVPTRSNKVSPRTFQMALAPRTNITEITWRMHIRMTEAKAFRTFSIRLYGKVLN
jgi:hypothetical protein